MECKSVQSSRTRSAQNEQLIDYCNYFLQTHFRLVNAFKYFKQRNDHQAIDERIQTNIYNILTDSLALITTYSFEEGGQHGHISKTKWNERFVAGFKEVRRLLKKTCGIGKSISLDALNKIESIDN